MNLTVVGAGNMGLAITAYTAVKDNVNVCLFTQKNVLEKGSLRLRDLEYDLDYTTDSFRVTDDPKEAFENADMILVTYPAFLRPDFISNYQKYIRPGSSVGFVPGYGGAEYYCVDLIRKGVCIFGFQRVPYVARASEDESGKTAGILSRKKNLFIGAIPSAKTPEVATVVEELLDIPVTQVKEYLSITLAPSNPLLHITGLYNVFSDHQAGQLYPHPMKFYEEWNDRTSELLFSYDEELQEICKALAPLDMSEVVPLPIYYESPTPEKMTQKLKSIESFKAVMVPLKKAETGYEPDLFSRMFVEDYPYGVCVIKDFAVMTGVKTPTVDLMLDFYQKLSGHRYFDEKGNYTEEIASTGVPGIHGLKTIQDIVDFYHK